MDTKCKEEMEGMSKTSPMLEKAIARLESFNQDEDAYLGAVKEYFYYLDEANHVEYGEKRGLERGLAQGLAQGRLEGEKKGRLEGVQEASLEIAKNLKIKNSLITLIMEVTGLSKEEIENL